jgi:hypothetical protein
MTLGTMLAIGISGGIVAMVRHVLALGNAKRARVMDAALAADQIAPVFLTKESRQRFR